MPNLRQHIFPSLRHGPPAALIPPARELMNHVAGQVTSPQELSQPNPSAYLGLPPSLRARKRSMAVAA
jgi:hypothetical protein